MPAPRIILNPSSVTVNGFQILVCALSEGIEQAIGFDTDPIVMINLIVNLQMIAPIEYDLPSMGVAPLLTILFGQTSFGPKS